MNTFQSFVKDFKNGAFPVAVIILTIVAAVVLTDLVMMAKGNPVRMSPKLLQLHWVDYIMLSVGYIIMSVHFGLVKR